MGGEVQPQHLMFAPLEPDPNNLFIHQDDRYDGYGDRYDDDDDDDDNHTPRTALCVSPSVGCSAGLLVLIFIICCFWIELPSSLLTSRPSLSV